LYSSPPRQLRRQQPARRPKRRSARQVHSRAPRRISTRTRLVFAGTGFVVLVFLWGVLARALAPTGNTAQTRFDAIIILGAGLDRDGNPDPALLSRITEGVREYERAIAPRLIVTGGEQHGFIQANVMARVAQAQGVPASAILVEPRAENTIQNACFSARIMKQHGWNSAEVVTSASHLPRAGILFSHLPIAWRMRTAPSLAETTAISAWIASADEDLHMVYYLLYSRWADRCSP
jgi:uncharacterized SAM-binding protein YcdF (DUF218 family)